jgi:hypothetical protein
MDDYSFQPNVIVVVVAVPAQTILNSFKLFVALKAVTYLYFKWWHSDSFTKLVRSFQLFKLIFSQLIFSIVHSTPS